MSEHGLEGPPEQETDIPEAKTSANDMWAQNKTQPKKAEVGWATRWSADQPVGPTDLSLRRGSS